jgi:hypothetical protein
MIIRLNKQCSPESILLYVFILTFWAGTLASMLLLISILSLISIKRIILQKRLINFSSIDVLFFLYAISALPGSILYGSEITYLKVVIYPWLIVHTISELKGVIEIDLVIKLLALSLIIVIVYIYFQKILGQFEFSLHYILTKHRDKFYLFSETPLGPTTISGLLVVFINILLFYIDTSKKVQFAVVFSIMMVSVYLVIVAASRTSYIALVVSFALYVFLKNIKSGLFKGTLYSSVLILVSGVVVYIAIHYSLPYFHHNYLARMDVLLTGRADNSLGTRIFLWNKAIFLSMDNPFGYGYTYFFEKYKLTTHNEILGQLVGGGFFALSFYLLIYWGALKAIFDFLKRGHNGQYQKFIMFFCVFIAYAITGLCENYSYSSSILIYPVYWILLAILLLHEKPYQTKKLVSIHGVKSAPNALNLK